MKIWIIAVLSLTVGVVLGMILAQFRGGGKRSQDRDVRWKTLEMMKQMVWVGFGNGIAWVWCSYILAALDKPQIAESLSQVAVTEIIGVVLAYCIKSAVENLSKNNRWPDRGEPPKDEVNDEDQASG